jgi:hypothetical protein
LLFGSCIECLVALWVFGALKSTLRSTTIRKLFFDKVPLCIF